MLPALSQGVNHPKTTTQFIPSVSMKENRINCDRHQLSIKFCCFDFKQHLLPHVSLTQAKYLGTSLTALAFRTAISAGVSEQAAGMIQNTILRKIDAINSSEQYWEIAKDALLQFSRAISTEKLSNYSDSVRQCCEYLHRNLHNNISLDELGQICHLSPHYVSDLFRQEVGIGGLQYFHQAKMQYAKLLLEYSDDGIAKIADLLSYPSHSNFSQRFKKIYGITPYEFRMYCAR